ncbi:GH3 auxin-responsive promoter family protein [bacterium]|nr:GH3 auxin-responsive promoter family protein [bacterium]
MIEKIIFSALYNIIRLEGGLKLKQYKKKLSNAVYYQEQVLMKKIYRSRLSDFGRKYNFSNIKTVEDFRRTVPIHTHQDLKPYLDRIQKGDVAALFNPGEKIIMFALTSGTTADCKYIPVTRQFLKEYKRGSLLWGFQMAEDHPHITKHKILPIVSPYDETRTDQGCPCGSISGLIASTQKYLARLLYIIPYWVYAIPDQEVKYYTLLRLAMAEPDIGLLTTANPSTLIKLARYADKYKEQIIKDIYDGTFCYPFELSLADRKKLKQCLIKNPRRANELDRLAMENDKLYPSLFWKNLQLIAAWKGGVLGHYIDELPQFYSDVPVRDLGLIASEGRMSIPNSDEGSCGLLDIESHFFEFIPEDQYGTDNPVVLLCHELEIGKNYYLILTNSAGYFRYDINDVIKVVDMHGQAPCISFLNKGKHISSLTGEKISEHQVVTAMKEAMRHCGVYIENFTVSPCWNKIPYYVILLEKSGKNEKIWLEELKKFFDLKLKEFNCEYCAKRDSLRLSAPKIVLIKKGTFDKIKNIKLKTSLGRAEQYKHIYLNPKVDYHKEFEIIDEF